MVKVICPGELLIDFICTDKNHLLVDGENFIKKAGGAPANVAVAISKMGVESSVLASVGNDQFGNFLIKTLEKYNVNTENIIKLNKASTTLAFVSLTSDGERDFNFIRNADSKYSFDYIPKDLIKGAKVFHFGSAMAFLGDELQNTYYKLLDYAKNNNKIVTFDPNYREALFSGREDLFKNHSINFIKESDIVKVSIEESMIITSKSNIEEAAKEIINLGAKYVLITLGSKGTLLANKDNIELIKSKPVKMVDATGAGDAFIGAVISKLALTEDLSYKAMKKFVEFGNKVGAETVKNYGALDSIPTIDQITK